MGTVNVTRSGRQCQHWSSNTPHQVYAGFTNIGRYPDRSLADANNYCRNPSTTNDKVLWCYTMDPNMRFEECDIPFCDGKSAADIGL